MNPIKRHTIPAPFVHAQASHDAATLIRLMTQSWLKDAQMVLTGVTESLGAMVNNPGTNGPSLILIQSDGMAQRWGAQGCTSLGIISLTHQGVLALSTEPLRGFSLQKAMQSMQSMMDDNALGDRMHASLAMELAACQKNSDYDGQIKAIDRANRDAMVSGGLVGRCIKQSVADGHAHYMVTKTVGDQVIVKHLDAVDGHLIAQWGEQAHVNKDWVKRIVKADDVMRRASSQHKGP